MGSVLPIPYLTKNTEENLESTDDEDIFHSQSSTPEQLNLINSNTNSDEFKMNLQFKLEAVSHGLQTDAIESKQIGSNNNRITFETVRDIEKYLDLYEKISLAFLLYENADLALQNLLTEIANAKNKTTINLIYNWAKSKHSPENAWQKQFLEALCIIEYYEILQRLGFDKSELITRFLPANPNTVLSINLVRKVLYIMCENFSQKQTGTFLNYLREDFKRKSIDWQEYDENYLELYILHCFSRDYIKECDLTNFMHILKKMNMDNVSEWLEYAMIVSRRNREPENHTSNRYSPKEKQDKMQKTEIRNISPVTERLEAKYTRDHSIIDRSISGDNSTDDESYNIDAKHVGICAIFNQKKFYKETDPALQYRVLIDHDLDERIGTNVDKDKLSETFKLLGFHIEIFEDKTHAEIESVISQMTKMFPKNDSCFVVCILSHGIEDCIYGANSVPVKIKDIEDLMYTNLIGKPKILIIQSCQGSALQGAITDDNSIVTDGITPIKALSSDKFNTTDGVNSIPAKSDFLLCSSTIVKYASIRDTQKGSWYIQELCKRIIRDCNKSHFADILIAVNNEVCKKRGMKDNQIVCMVPEFRTTFRKKLFLPIINQTSEELQ
ncbi:Death related ced-3/Nedd2-like caspase [Carabus blaptoides fortunei]